MKRGGSVRIGRRAHYSDVAGSNPALASIGLSPLGCTEHKNEGRASRLFWAFFVGKSLVFGLFKPLFFAMKIIYLIESETFGLKYSVWTGSCIL